MPCSRSPCTLHWQLWVCLGCVESFSKICVLERQKSRVSQGWWYLPIPLLLEHFVVFLCYLLHKATLLHFFCSTLALNLYGRVVGWFLRIPLNLEDARKIMQNNWWELPSWGTQCVMYINLEGFFLNGVEYIMCQVKKSSNKLVKHLSKREDNWKKWKSNSENIAFLHIPRWDRCCILWLHIAWILILVQVNGKLIHFGWGEERGGIGTKKLFQTVSVCQGDHFKHCSVA